jgi:hypothetical protein
LAEEDTEHILPRCGDLKGEIIAMRS